MNCPVVKETRIGTRRMNQDCIGSWSTSACVLLAVADGLGGHLHGEVELRCNLRVTLLKLKEVLLELVVAKQRVVVVGWVVDNSTSKLGRRGGNR